MNSDPKTMTLEELQEERTSLRQRIKHQQRCGRRTPELQEMKLRNVKLKDEIALRNRPQPQSRVEVPPTAEVFDFPESDLTCFHSPVTVPASVVQERPLLKVANG